MRAEDALKRLWLLGKGSNNPNINYEQNRTMIKMKSWGHLVLAVVYVLLYVAQFWVVTSQVSRWTGKIWLALIISLAIVFLRIPIRILPFDVPWFLAVNWYFEGTIWIGQWGLWTWGYLFTWIIIGLIENIYGGSPLKDGSGDSKPTG